MFSTAGQEVGASFTCQPQVPTQSSSICRVRFSFNLVTGIRRKVHTGKGELVGLGETSLRDKALDSNAEAPYSPRM